MTFRFLAILEVVGLPSFLIQGYRYDINDTLRRKREETGHIAWAHLVDMTNRGNNIAKITRETEFHGPCSGSWSRFWFET